MNKVQKYMTCPGSHSEIAKWSPPPSSPGSIQFEVAVLLMALTSLPNISGIGAGTLSCLLDYTLFRGRHLLYFPPHHLGSLAEDLAQNKRSTMCVPSNAVCSGSL